MLLPDKSGRSLWAEYALEGSRLLTALGMPEIMVAGGGFDLCIEHSLWIPVVLASQRLDLFAWGPTLYILAYLTLAYVVSFFILPQIWEVGRISDVSCVNAYLTSEFASARTGRCSLSSPHLTIRSPPSPQS